jgi:serine/threonine protein kinase
MGQPYGEHTDLWAIGILTYELMVGTIPFDISHEEELSKIVCSNINQVNDDIKFPPNIELSD